MEIKSAILSKQLCHGELSRTGQDTIMFGRLCTTMGLTITVSHFEIWHQMQQT